MHAIPTLAFILSFFATALPSQTAEPARDARDHRVLADALNRFAADLHGRLAGTGNPTCSPASIAFALLMLLPGARDNTRDEIAKALRLPAELRGDALHQAAANLLRETAFEKGLDLRIANDFWGQLGHEFVPAYTELLQRSFASKPHTVDFRTDCDRARQQINRHIARVTNQRITELIPAGTLTSETRTVITNAIWYRGQWQHDFYRPDEPGTFHITPDRAVAAPMMHLTKDLYYTESEAWQAVSLPFKDQAIAFELIVPRQGQSLETAERALVLGRHQNQRNARLVQVSMPAFRVRAEHRLHTALAALGIRDAFAVDRADFSGIDASQPLHLSEIVHATWIQVDEHGVEAAAATAGILAGAAIRERPTPLVADRPFAFGLRDRRTGLLLFVGRCTDPTTEG